MPLRSINLRPALIVAVVLGGAVLLVIQVRVALGLDEPQPSAAASSFAASPVTAPPVIASAIETTGPAIPSTNPPERIVAHTQAHARPLTRLPAPLLVPAAVPSPADAAPESAANDAGPTRKSCMDGLEEARKLATALPADDPSRYFAERNLLQAKSEADNGEYDECAEWIAQATDEIKEHRHTLAPGEKLKVLRPDEIGP
jgi:hypothetical protein